MPSSMSKTKTLRFIQYVEDQGVMVTRTTKGLLCRFPDGTTEMVHFTPSDSRGIRNQVAQFRRAGVVHPDDPQASEGLPAYITKMGVSTKTKDQILEVVERLGFPPSVTTADFLPMDPVIVGRALYHMGYVPQPTRNKRPKRRKWFAPSELIRVQEPDEGDQEIEIEPEVSGTQEVVVQDEREFIDTVDSWTVSVEAIPSNVSVRDYLQSLMSAGLQGEIRVWRRPER